MGLKLEQRRRGLAVVAEGLRTPLGYVRGNKWQMMRDGECVDVSPEDLERIAAEIREVDAKRVYRVDANRNVTLRA